MKVIKATATEAKIFDAIKEVKAKGIKITDGAWNVKWSKGKSKFVCDGNKCCPLGAVLLTNDLEDFDFDLVESLADGENDSDRLAHAVAQVLGKDFEWCEDFVEAFDSPEPYGYNSKGSRKAALKVRELEFNEVYGLTKKS